MLSSLLGSAIGEGAGTGLKWGGALLRGFRNGGMDGAMQALSRQLDDAVASLRHPFRLASASPGPRPYGTAGKRPGVWVQSGVKAGSDGRSTPQWISELLVNRVVNKPNMTSPIHAINMLRTSINSIVSSKPDTNLVIALLEVDGKSVLGVNNGWDWPLTKQIKGTDDLSLGVLVDRGDLAAPSGYNGHAELNAITEYMHFHDRPISPQYGKLFVSEVPCTRCVFRNRETGKRFDDLRGNIRSSMQGIFTHLELNFPGNPHDGFSNNHTISLY